MVDNDTNPLQNIVTYNNEFLGTNSLFIIILEAQEQEEEETEEQIEEIVEEKSLNQLVVETAMKYLGVPYVWGGTTPNGFDCSGLVQYVYKEVGISLSRTTYTQVKEGELVSRSELIEGDLIFFGKQVHHVAIYIGDGNIIHAPQTGDVVKIISLSDRRDYNCAKRIINE